MTILITGGTGNLGRHLTPLLAGATGGVRVLSRKPHQAGDGISYVTGDLLQDQGVAAAVAGADTIVHLAGSYKGDTQATRNLLREAARAGTSHLLYISVTAPDRLPFRYYKEKYGAEKAIQASATPWTILRAAQFHDLVAIAAGFLAKSLVVPVPSGIRLQPVDVRDVAERLAELALAPPAGFVPDIVGPTVYTSGHLFRDWLHAAGKRRLLLPVRMPGAAGRTYRAGGNLVLDGAQIGKRSWEEYLTERYGRRD